MLKTEQKETLDIQIISHDKKWADKFRLYGLPSFTKALKDIVRTHDRHYLSNIVGVAYLLSLFLDNSDYLPDDLKKLRNQASYDMKFADKFFTQFQHNHRQKLLDLEEQYFYRVVHAVATHAEQILD